MSNSVSSPDQKTENKSAKSLSESFQEVENGKMTIEAFITNVDKLFCVNISSDDFLVEVVTNALKEMGNLSGFNNFLTQSVIPYIGNYDKVKIANDLKEYRVAQRGLKQDRFEKQRLSYSSR